MNDIIPHDQALERAAKLNLLTPTGLNLPDTLTDVDAYCIAVQLTTTDNAVGWGRGDLAHYLMRQYPNDFRQVWSRVFPKRAYDTLYNDARTSQQYTHEERYRYCIEDGLSFGHCQKAGHLPEEEREDALIMARDNDWNVRQLEAYIYGSNTALLPTAQQSPSRDNIRLQYAAWMETVAAPDREYARYYVSLFVDWLESQPNEYPRGNSLTS